MEIRSNYVTGLAVALLPRLFHFEFVKIIFIMGVLRVSREELNYYCEV